MSSATSPRRWASPGSTLVARPSERLPPLRGRTPFRPGPPETRAMITYQQFKNFLLHAERKVFYVFTYQNAVGCIIGWMVGRWLSTQLPFLPGPLCWLLGVVLGLVATWPHEGRAR